MKPIDQAPTTDDTLPPQMLDWRSQLQVLRERRWLLLSTAGAIIVLTLFWLGRATSQYEATAQILIESETAKILNIQDVISSEARDLQSINTEVKILQSPTLMRQAAETMKLAEDPRFVLKELPPTTALGKAAAQCLTSATELWRRMTDLLQPAADPRLLPKKVPASTDIGKALAGCLTIHADRNSRLITITAVHRAPDMAAQLANGLAEEYIRGNLNRRLSASLEAVTWLHEQAEEIKPKMAKSELALQEYRETNHAVSLEERQNIVVDKLKALSASLTQAHTDRLAAEVEWKAIQTALANKITVTMIPLIAADTQVKVLQTQLNGNEIALSSLRERYKADYPAIVAARAELREVTEKLAVAGTAAVSAAQEKYQIAKSKEDSLATALQEQEQQALKLDRILTGYSALKRNAETDQQLYQSIMTRMKETSVAGKLATSNSRLVDPAVPPKAPASQRTLLKLLAGSMFGLMAGIALCLLVEQRHKKIKCTEDLESLGVAVLGVVPRVRPAPANEHSYLSEESPYALEAEHFRDLRACLMLSSQAVQPKVLLVTSTIPGEGKTFVTANLSAISAHSGERTLLVDMDFYNKALQRVFALPDGPGLADFLGSKAALETVVLRTKIPNLDIIPAGRTPGNPQELLGSPRMRELLVCARQKYDRILIDSAPLGAVSDALMLLPQMDGVVFVVQFGTAERDFIQRTLQKLQACHAPLTGAVLNNVDLKKYQYCFPYEGRYTEQYTRPHDAAATAPA